MLGPLFDLTMEQTMASKPQRAVVHAEQNACRVTNSERSAHLNNHHARQNLTQVISL